MTDEQFCFFTKNGYLIIDDVFSINKLNKIEFYLKNMISLQIKKAKKEYPNKENILKETIGYELCKGINALETINHKYILEFYSSLDVSNCPYTSQLIGQQNILDYINELLKLDVTNPLFVTSGSILFAAPNDNLYTANKWHTDVFYTFKDGQYIHFWAPLIENTSKELGAIHVLPGSHKKPFQGQIRDTSRKDSSIHKYVISDNVLEEYEDKVIELKLGQGLFFDQHLIHRGGFNSTNRSRFGVIGFYHSMSNPSFSPYPLNHPKQISADEYFDEIMS